VKPWHRLPREVGDAPSLGTSQARLDGALSSLVWLKMPLLTAGGLGWVASAGPFQPKAFCDDNSRWKSDLGCLGVMEEQHQALRMREWLWPGLV